MLGTTLLSDYREHDVNKESSGIFQPYTLFDLGFAGLTSRRGTSLSSSLLNILIDVYGPIDPDPPTTYDTFQPTTALNWFQETTLGWSMATNNVNCNGAMNNVPEKPCTDPDYPLCLGYVHNARWGRCYEKYWQNYGSIGQSSRVVPSMAEDDLTLWPPLPPVGRDATGGRTVKRITLKMKVDPGEHQE